MLGRSHPSGKRSRFEKPSGSGYTDSSLKVSYECWARPDQHNQNRAHRSRLPGSRLNGDRMARPLLYVHSYFSFCCCRGCLAGYLWKTIGLEFHFSANVWPPKEGNQEDRVTLATGLLSFRQLGSIGFHPSLDPATKLLCIRSIWTTFGRILHLKGFEALNPLRINEPIKSSSGYVYQFHLSTLLHDIIATQLPDTQHRCRVTDGGRRSQSCVLALTVGRLVGAGVARIWKLNVEESEKTKEPLRQH